MTTDPISSVQDDEQNRGSESLRGPEFFSSFIPEPFLDTEEAAGIMKIHPKTLQKLARKGLVRGIHVGKLWRFRASEIERWAQQQMAG